jgi:hypothetical protein
VWVCVCSCQGCRRHRPRYTFCSKRSVPPPILFRTSYDCTNVVYMCSPTVRGCSRRFPRFAGAIPVLIILGVPYWIKRTIPFLFVRAIAVAVVRCSIQKGWCYCCGGYYYSGFPVKGVGHIHTHTQSPQRLPL